MKHLTIAWSTLAATSLFELTGTELFRYTKIAYRIVFNSKGLNVQLYIRTTLIKLRQYIENIRMNVHYNIKVIFGLRMEG